MSFPDNNLNQTCVYWGTPVANGRGGFTFADPVELSCRWVEKVRLIRNSEGEQVVSMATVQVNQDLDNNGILYLGDLDGLDSSEEADPTTISTAYRIISFTKSPTVKGNKYCRRAFL